MSAWRGLRNEQGQSAIEMAMAMPLFLMVVFGMVQVALVTQTYCNATYACRNAARFAALNSPTSLAALAAGASAGTGSAATQAEAAYAGAQALAMVKSGLFLNSSITPNVTVLYSTGPFVAGSTPTFSASGTNAVGNLVQVKVTWSQTIHIPFIPAINFSVGTQTTRLISR